MIDTVSAALAGNNTVTMILFAAVLLALVIYKKIDLRALKSYEEYESKSLEERIWPDLKFMTRRLGKDIDVPLYHGDHNHLGRAQKVMFKDVDEGDFENVGFDTDEDEQEVEVAVIMVCPTKEGFLSLEYWMWYISDILFDNNSNTNLWVVRKESIAEHNIDRLKISKDVDFSSYAGVFHEDEPASVAMVKSIAWRKNNEMLQNKFPEFAEKLSEADPNHAQTISEIKEVNKQNVEQDMRQMAKK